jgi:hypothetical protein
MSSAVSATVRLQDLNSDLNLAGLSLISGFVMFLSLSKRILILVPATEHGYFAAS